MPLKSPVKPLLPVSPCLATSTAETDQRAVPPRTTTLQTVPLPRRKPPRPGRDALVTPDPALVRKYKGLPAEDPKPPMAPLSAFELPPDLTANTLTQDDLRRAYSATNARDPKEFDVNMPALPEMEGVGKYRMAKNASDQHRISHLRRATSDLGPQMVDEIADLSIVDPQLLRAAASRPPSPTSSSIRMTKSVPIKPPSPAKYVEYVDHHRSGSLVQRGFSPSTSSSLSSSLNEGIRRRNRKYSSVSESSVSSEGEPRSRRKMARQGSIPMVESGSSPLRAIKEDADPSTEPTEAFPSLRSPKKYLEDSAVLSDGEEDATGRAIVQPAPRRPSALSTLLSPSLRHRRANKEKVQVNRPIADASDDADEDRSRMRSKWSALKRGKSPKRRGARQLRFAGHANATHEPEVRKKSAASSNSKAPNQNPESSASTWETMRSDAVEQATSAVPIPGSHTVGISSEQVLSDRRANPNTDAGSEAGDGPDDLAAFMVGRRSSHRNDDDNASVASASTAQTTIPWHRQVLHTLTGGVKRDRSATVIHCPQVLAEADAAEQNTQKADD